MKLLRGKRKSKVCYISQKMPFYTFTLSVRDSQQSKQAPTLSLSEDKQRNNGS